MDGGAYTERPAYFGEGSSDGAGRLFGVLTEPAGPERGVAAIVLSGGGRKGAGGTPHPGRNGISVRLARHLAAQGVHAFRMDYRGVGESWGDAEAYQLRDPFPGDVEAAARWIEAQGVGEHVLLGACFGGRAAVAAACRLPAVRGVALYGAPVRDFERGERLASQPLSWYARKALSRRGLAGLLDPGRRAAFVRLGRRKLAHVARSWRTTGGRGGADLRGISPTLVAQLGELAERGVPVLFVFGTDDDFRADFERGRQGRLGEVIERSGSRISVEVVPGKVHGLTTIGVQDEVVRVTDAWLARVLGPTTARGRGGPTASGQEQPARRTDPATGVTEEARYAGDGGRRVFVVEHTPPAPHRLGAMGVVVCPPISADFLRNYRRELLMARALAGEGLAVARFHYRGTGDSDGDPRETTFEAMVADALAAAAALVERHGVETVALVGTRFGALVAGAAAGALGPAQGPVVLVEPTGRAERFFREGFRADLAQRAATAGRPPATTAKLLAELDERGTIDVLGHAVHRALYQSASGRTLAAELEAVNGPVLAVALGAEDSPRPDLEGLVDDLRARGVAAELRRVGRAESWWFLDEAEAPGEGLAALVAGWLGASREPGPAAHPAGREAVS